MIRGCAALLLKSPQRLLTTHRKFTRFCMASFIALRASR
jgi:hypothetical protein